MKEINVTIGQWYVVEGAAGDTVTNPSTGRPIATVAEGKQTSFYATTAVVVASSDSVQVYRANFKSAPAKLMALGLLGGGNSAFKKLTLEEALALANLPAGGGKMRVSLPWEAQLLVSGVPAALQTAKSKGWTITVQYREPEADNAYYNKYAQCVTVADMIAVNPDYKNDLTADGAWLYPLPKLQNAEMAFASMRCKSATFYMPEVVLGRRIFQVLRGKTNGYVESVEVYAPKLILKSNYYEGVELTFIEAQIRELKVEFSPATTYISKDFAIFGLQNFEMNEMPNLTGLPSAFQHTELNKTSILRLIEQLPTWESGNHPATFGIHTDLQTDEDVIAAIANAESKGWTLTVQWNGTPTAQTASTFGLRKPPIYAKLGSMQLPDGTTETVLDWGHYVTNAEANGYMEFSSVEGAREHFGLPAVQDELLTNSTTNEHE